ncbi:MAG: hypothetical protein R6V62_11170 [Candidatus Fermentibacteraceae bacterium]
MKTRALKVTLLVLALLAGAAFAVGHDDHPCTGDGHDGTECTCESECEDCTCDSLSRAEETSAPIDDIEEAGCRGCPGHGCR